MTAAGARGLQTVISIRVQPTEDLLPTTLHLSTDSLKSTKIQKKRKKKYRTNQATKEGELKDKMKNKQIASEETFIIRAHRSWFSLP